jgi:hypothetical protein
MAVGLRFAVGLLFEAEFPATGFDFLTLGMAGAT